MSARPPRRRRRRRIPRRRFHALRIDTLLMLFVVAAVVAAFPSGEVFRSLRPAAATSEPFAMSLAVASEPDALRSPVLFAFGDPDYVPEEPPPPEDAAAVDARRARPLPAIGLGDGDDEPLLVPLPESALATRLEPSPSLRPPPLPPIQLPPASESEPMREPGTMTLFYPTLGTLPTVVVDAPSLPISAIPALEAKAFGTRVPASSTSRVVRVEL